MHFGRYLGIGFLVWNAPADLPMDDLALPTLLTESNLTHIAKPDTSLG